VGAASWRVACHGDGVAGEIAADGADARTQLGGEVLDPDALSDVSLSQIVLEVVEAQVARSKRTGRAESQRGYVVADLLTRDKVLVEMHAD
jgi:hypothetical protein